MSGQPAPETTPSAPASPPASAGAAAALRALLQQLAEVEAALRVQLRVARRVTTDQATARATLAAGRELPRTLAPVRIADDIHERLRRVDAGGTVAGRAAADGWTAFACQLERCDVAAAGDAAAGGTPVAGTLGDAAARREAIEVAYGELTALVEEAAAPLQGGEGVRDLSTDALLRALLVSKCAAVLEPKLRLQRGLLPDPTPAHAHAQRTGARLREVAAPTPYARHTRESAVVAAEGLRAAVGEGGWLPARLRPAPPERGAAGAPAAGVRLGERRLQNDELSAGGLGRRAAAAVGAGGRLGKASDAELQAEQQRALALAVQRLAADALLEPMRLAAATDPPAYLELHRLLHTLGAGRGGQRRTLSIIRDPSPAG
jgi:hypothetical protein